MKIMVAIPNTGEVVAGLAQWIAETECKPVFFKDAPVDCNRNNILHAFRESEFDGLLMVDSDVVPCHKLFATIYDAVGLGIEALASPCPIYSNSTGHTYWNAGWRAPAAGQYQTAILTNTDFTKSPKKRYKPDDGCGLLKIDRIGTGCFFVTRSALEKANWPQFQFVRDENGMRIQGEDYNFCDQLTDAGVEIYATLDNTAAHIKGGVPLEVV